MKLYSRGQLAFFCLASILLTVVVLGAAGALRLGENSQAGSPAANEAPPASEDQNFFAPAKPVSYTQDETENISVYDKANRAVVNLSTEVIGYNWFFEPTPQSGGSGSGSIIDKRGYVLTNYHVVKDAVKLTVSLYDGSQYEGSVVGVDQENDLAVVKFDPEGKDLPALGFGSSGNLKVGQKVLAIGNPFAFERTLTVGIISGLGRPLRNGSGMVIQNMIQTDASINPGNSGGPLLDGAGQIIGINTMIYTPSGGSVGIGFAVPVDTAKRIAADLVQYGKVSRGALDAQLISIFPSLARYAGLKVSQGVLVSSVASGGYADKAGLRGGDRNKAVRISNQVVYLGGDIITRINGKEIADLSGYYAALEQSRPGDEAEITVLRGSGQTANLKITLAER